jgi:GNAT superfamily N-acetyltransferase
VATQDTVTQLVAAVRKVARVVPGAAEVIAEVCRLDYSAPGKPPIDWDDPQAKQQLVSDLVNDALAVLAELAGEGAPERDAAAADALGLLALVAGQDVEPAGGSDGTGGRWRIARKVAPDRVSGTAMTYVWTGDRGPHVVAYYAIAPHQVLREEVSGGLAGGVGVIPAYLLARLAVDQSLQGRGLGGELLHDALSRVVSAADVASGRLVVVDAIDGQAAAFYRHHDFMPVRDNPLRLVLKISTLRKAIGS